MMKFETVAVGNNAPDIYMATNSIKPVIIRAESEADFLLDMPLGDLNNDFKIMGEYFESFEAARRWAERFVGVIFDLEETA